MFCYSSWSPRNCIPVIDLLDEWIPLFSDWIVTNILDQLIMPKLHVRTITTHHTMHLNISLEIVFLVYMYNSIPHIYRGMYICISMNLNIHKYMFHTAEICDWEEFFIIFLSLNLCWCSHIWDSLKFNSSNFPKAHLLIYFPCQIFAQ